MMPEIFSVMNQQCTALLGQPVTYKPATGVPYTLNAILDRRTEEQRAADGVYARLFANLTDFATTPVAGDRVVVGARTFLVFGDPEEDPGGGVWLSLREV